MKNKSVHRYYKFSRIRHVLVETTRQYDVTIKRNLKIFNWHESKVCRTRNFLLALYEKNKKIREKMKSL